MKKYLSSCFRYCFGMAACGNGNVDGDNSEAGSNDAAGGHGSIEDMVVEIDGVVYKVRRSSLFFAR